MFLSDTTCVLSKFMERSHILLDGNVPRGIEVSTGCYRKYPAGGKYLDLTEFLKIEPNPANILQLGRKLLAQVRAHVKHKNSQ